MVLYFVSTPRVASLVEQVGFPADKLVRVQEHPPEKDDDQFETVCLAVPSDIDLYEHGVVSAITPQCREWLLSPNFLNKFQRVRWLKATSVQACTMPASIVGIGAWVGRI